MSNPSKPFRGRAIYQSGGAAREYSKWACNLFNGCSNRCDYCYNRHSMASKLLGADEVTMKKCLSADPTAKNYYVSVLRAEIFEHEDEIKHDGGLFFSFVSDPLLPETAHYAFNAIMTAIKCGVDVTILTKSAWWLKGEDYKPTYEDFQQNTLQYRAFLISSLLIDMRNYIQLGFTLTGEDAMERHCISTTQERIAAMKWAHDNGIYTLASIEPVINYEHALGVIILSLPYCKEYRIGLASKLGIKYDPADVLRFKRCVETTIGDKAKIVWKKSVLDKNK